MPTAGKSNPFIVVSPCNGNENLINNAALSVLDILGKQ